jgi:hypothetical protein
MLELPSWFLVGVLFCLLIHVLRLVREPKKEEGPPMRIEMMIQHQVEFDGNVTVFHGCEEDGDDGEGDDMEKPPSHDELERLRKQDEKARQHPHYRPHHAPGPRGTPPGGVRVPLVPIPEPPAKEG